tara:strand:+ start:1543 stop:2151 length:609 start_codon:yes stop_codon:yes gene_type:complete
MNIYKAINAVQAELSTIGITKDRTNSQGSGYKFRGIDDVYNAISPLLAKHGLCILPRVLTRECVERISKSGGALFYVTVEVEFDFVSAEDGSKHTVKTFGEAMDSGDKATNKAMSAAYKYAAFQAFSIPTESDNDADAVTHVVQSTEATIKAILADIAECKTHDELKEAFYNGIRAAGNNPVARDQITKAKDEQKATLKGTP